jgi:succinoglycan biosynthesis protein ExoA
MKHMSSAVSIIVQCRNERNHIAACVHSILAQAETPGGMEIIAADGQSDDGTRDMLAQLAARNSCPRVFGNPRCIILK